MNTIFDGFEMVHSPASFTFNYDIFFTAVCIKFYITKNVTISKNALSYINIFYNLLISESFAIRI